MRGVRPFFALKNRKGWCAEMLKNLDHEKFCREYVIDHNGTQAAIRAGYAKDTAAQQASRLLRRADIRARVEELNKDVCDALGLKAYWVAARLMEVVDRCLQKVPVKEWDYELHEYVETGEWQFDSRGANGALEQLGKYLGMFDKKSVTVEADSGTKIRVTLEDD